MNIETIPSGVYIVAVSGGVDSVVLLDLLTKEHSLKLVVAHFDHGIRSNSSRDRKFVESLAQKYVLPFEYQEGKLGSKASEDTARIARYKFLDSIKDKYKAQAIITAHHQDDVLETIMLNILRGTGRKGLSSLRSTNNIVRPLLHVSKSEIRDYAKAHKIKWVEDKTNQNVAYLRNWIRLTVVPRLTSDQREQLVSLYETSKTINDDIDQSLQTMMNVEEPDSMNAKVFTRLSHALARELCASWLRQNNIADFDSKTIERLTVGMKTLTKNKTLNVKKGYDIVRDGDAFYIRHNNR